MPTTVTENQIGKPEIGKKIGGLAKIPKIFPFFFPISFPFPFLMCWRGKRLIPISRNFSTTIYTPTVAYFGWGHMGNAPPPLRPIKGKNVFRSSKKGLKFKKFSPAAPVGIAGLQFL